ncbi:anthranilate synthase / indole-3-glycerol phosphate synthase [Kickxella alabastrina]|uniref:Anthranilate synthase / indole-3-glycerol phosphate synthase n=1 Tax=Kickxella alabastrina TaxID=61397 RepID=A0ACC1IX94_9FUNG|nr:anthranilate synthase / indole-3-glycerol phosphate synthase [Kickxella alabastrina]
MSTTLGNKRDTVVKICGVRTVDAALAAADAGADIIGMIFAPSPRLIDIATGQQIAQAVRQTNTQQQQNPAQLHSSINKDATPAEFFTACADHILSIKGQESRPGPLLVGVFQNQALEHILEVARSVPLDMVQLHGDEPVELAREIPVPVIKVFHVDDTFSSDSESDLFKTFCHSVVLLDTKVAGTSQQGGKGVSFDWSIAGKLADKGVPFLMAGGLTPENIGRAVGVGRPWGVDVSSGIETDKVKDPKKIHAFVVNAKKNSEPSA